MMSIGRMATLACLLEVSAPKPGNVHRGADFHDTHLVDFLASANAIGGPVDRVQQSKVGQTILDCALATREVTSKNTNLGLILLIVPLAKAFDGRTISPDGVAKVLESLDAHDADKVYQAIRVMSPGGLGQVDRYDVNHEPPQDLIAAMKLVANDDLVARQYVENFESVFDFVLPSLLESRATCETWADTIVFTHVRVMSQFPDSLIQRKCGSQVASESSARATKVLDAGQPGDENYYRALSELDFWLRSDHNRRNPGTTADLIGAALFVGIADKKIIPPFT